MASDERFAGPGADTLSELAGELETLKSDEFEARVAVASSVETLYLRVLYHTDVRRWGEVARLGGLSPGQVFELSRAVPSFRRGNSLGGAPLAEPHVSRNPLVIATETAGVRVSAPAGMASDATGNGLESARVSYEQLRVEGYELQLGRRVRLRLGVQREYRGPSYGLTGSSAAVNELRHAIHRVSDLQVPVLIRGETGVGKERVAQAIHEASTRAGAPCVCFNMALATRDTAASELFGHVRGAFTGALNARSGLFERAHSGTLFLDEIGELDHDVQAMLLRVLESGVFTPLGGSTERVADVRLMSATDADLQQLVEAGRFRAALFHRLSGFVIPVPSLRSRREDIPELALAFLQQELARVGESARLGRWDPRANPWFPPELMRDLLAYQWGGNVRELGNLIRQLCVSNRGRSVYAPDAGASQQLARPRAVVASGSEHPVPREIGEAALVQALRAHSFAVGPTAAALGIPRSTLYGLMERSDSVRKATDLSESELRRGLQENGGNQAALAAQLEVSERALRLRLRALGMLD